MYCIANWFNLSDTACEDALYDVAVFREFCRIDLGRERKLNICGDENALMQDLPSLALPSKASHNCIAIAMQLWRKKESI